MQSETAVTKFRIYSKLHQVISREWDGVAKKKKKKKLLGCTNRNVTLQIRGMISRAEASTSK